MLPDAIVFEGGDCGSNRFVGSQTGAVGLYLSRVVHAQGVWFITMMETLDLTFMAMPSV